MNECEKCKRLENFIPSAEQINALPLKLRRFIVDLELRADPAGDVREAIYWKETAEALAKKVAELREQLTPDRS